ncbi:MAG: phenylalanine--tRNA ligase subunit beta [Weeksellaceae bacterium]|nr:phenylalanine--tRNA ligase subunit beta [Weeksellaceae bacterium]
MKISYNWLKDFIKTDLTPEQIAEILTDIGLEVETVEKTGVSAEDLEGVMVGEVLECSQHPNADKLRCTVVNIGSDDALNIVCGAPNVRQGLKVAVATIGTTIKVDKTNSFEIKKAKIRGEASEGMLCSEKELGLGADTSGIWELPSDYTIGSKLSDNVTLGTDYIFEIGLTPNRADAMSHLGVARDLYAAMKFRGQKAEWVYQETETNLDLKNPQNFEISLPDEQCNRYCGLLLENVEVQASPEWMQTKLQSIGITPKNNVVDVTNYVMHSIGQPMHAFDAAHISQDKIIVQKTGKTEKFDTLDGVTRELKGTELMICDAEKPLAIAGVMGGAESAVTQSTQRVFLESAHFEPVGLRKTAKAHAIHSDSSFRFERGTDPQLPPKGIFMAAELLQKYANASIATPLIDVCNNLPKGALINFRPQRAAEIIGEAISKEDLESIFQLLDIKIIESNDEAYQLQIPAYRVDVTREIDLIEDIMRIYGYNEFKTPGKINMALVAGEGFQEENLLDLISSHLVSHGFHEAMNLSLYHEKYNEWLNLDTDSSVHILNALSAELAVMRRHMLPGLLENVIYNINRRQETTALFELGYTYKQTSNGYQENKRLAIILSGLQHAEHWKYGKQASNFYHLKGIIDNLLKRLNISPSINQLQGQNPYDQHLEYHVDNQLLLSVGIISPSLSKKFDVSQPVFFADCDMAMLQKLYLGKPGVKYQNIPQFPSVRRDLALLINNDVTYQSLVDQVNRLGIKEIKNISLFDEYQGDKLPANKKSYALAFELINENKTMNDQEIDAIMQKVIRQMEKSGAELRKG